MNPIMENILGVLYTVLMVVAPVIISLLGGAAIKYISSLCKKNKINISDNMMKDIEDIIMKVVRMINQTIVNDLKSQSPTGKLTEAQKIQIFNISKSTIIACLNQPQINQLIEKYSSIDNAMQILIENAVVETKNNHEVIKHVDNVPENSDIAKQLDAVAKDVSSDRVMSVEELIANN